MLSPAEANLGAAVAVSALVVNVVAILLFVEVSGALVEAARERKFGHESYKDIRKRFKHQRKWVQMRERWSSGNEDK